MEPDEPLSETDPLLCEALSWVIRLRSGEATDVDLDNLRRWRGMGREHEEAFRDAVRLWRACGEAARQLAEETETASPSSDPPSDLDPSPSRLGRRVAWRR